MIIRLNNGLLFGLILCLLMFLLLLQSGCTVSSGVKSIAILDEKGHCIDNVLVVPLYYQSFVIAFGPDGSGGSAHDKTIITKPYEVNSGDDFLKSIEKSKGLFIPPILFIGNNNYIDNWLLLKKGFKAKLIRREDVFSNDKIIMTTTSTDDVKNILTMLLNPKINQKSLKKQFGIEESKQDIVTKFDEKDTALLMKYQQYVY